jgi:hypothetical protein
MRLVRIVVVNNGEGEYFKLCLKLSFNHLLEQLSYMLGRVAYDIKNLIR